MGGMPAAHGKEPREEKFLLRMTKGEKSYVRTLATTRRSSLNDAITGLIRDAMDAERRVPDLPPAPVRPAQKPGPRRDLGERGRAGAAADTFTGKFDAIPGQDDIPIPGIDQ